MADSRKFDLKLQEATIADEVEQVGSLHLVQYLIVD